MSLPDLIKQILNIFKSDKQTIKSYNFNDMDTAINFWLQMFENKPVWKSNTIQAHNLPAVIASEFARLVTVEMKSEVTGSKRAEYIQEQYNRLLKLIRVKTELACAGGSMIFKPYISNNKIYPDCCRADCFIPLKFDEERITDIAFFDRIQVGRWTYTRVERQTFNGSEHIITNQAFRSSDINMLGSPVSLEEVPEWANIPESIAINNVERPLFGYFKMPFANQIDIKSPLGVSVYSRAVNDIKNFDKQFSYYLWEFEGGQMAIDASEDIIRPAPNSSIVSKYKFKTEADKLPESRDRLFTRLFRNVNTAKDDLYQVFAPQLRDNSYERGLDRILRQIECNCSLAYVTFSNVQNTDKTAEEVKASKHRSYSAVCDIQSALQIALEDYIYSLDILTTAFNLAPAGKYEVSFEWGDGVLEDSIREQTVMLQEVSAGLIKKEKYLSYRYGVTEEQAKEMLPEQDTFNVNDFGV